MRRQGQTHCRSDTVSAGGRLQSTYFISLTASASPVSPSLHPPFTVASNAGQAELQIKPHPRSQPVLPGSYRRGWTWLSRLPNFVDKCRLVPRPAGCCLPAQFLRNSPHASFQRDMAFRQAASYGYCSRPLQPVDRAASGPIDSGSAAVPRHLPGRVSSFRRCDGASLHQISQCASDTATPQNCHNTETSPCNPLLPWYRASLSRGCLR